MQEKVSEDIWLSYLKGLHMDLLTVAAAHRGERNSFLPKLRDLRSAFLETIIQIFWRS